MTVREFDSDCSFAETIEWLSEAHLRDNFITVSKLEEIEAAVESLPSEQKQELMLFPATRLRA